MQYWEGSFRLKVKESNGRYTASVGKGKTEIGGIWLTDYKEQDSNGCIGKKGACIN